MVYKRSAVHCCRCLASWLLLLAANEGLNLALGLGGQPHGSGDVEVHDCVSRMQQACKREDLVSSAELLKSPRTAAAQPAAAFAQYASGRPL